jgi:putative SOS response-associated peptidase YedK
MCGRFTLTLDTPELQEQFPGFTFPRRVEPRYNIAPAQPVLAAANDDNTTAVFLTWGLVPSWSKDPQIGSRMINARAETLAEKPSFRGSLKYKRCVIFADGFFEWKPVPGAKTKIPYYAQLAGGEAFGFAGLWDNWQSSDGSLIRSCTIITTTPNSLMAPIHNRMPVILDRSAFGTWLDPSPRTAQVLQPLLQPFSAEAMRVHTVSPFVNRPANEGPECIAPA